MSIADERRATRDEAVERAKAFHMFDPEMAEPWTALKAFREQCPVARSEAFDGYWILSKRDDAQKALANQAHFSTAQVTIPKVEDPLGRQIPLEYDPPEHKRYRADLNTFFSPEAVAKKEPEVRERARGYLEAIAAKGGGELISEFCVPLPALTFLVALGGPLDDVEQLLEWKHQMIHEGLSGDPVKAAYVDSVIRPRVGEYWGALLDARVNDPDPPDDVLTGLTRAFVGDRPFTRNEQIRAVSLMMTAGLDTVTAMLSMSLWYLATHPSARRALAEQPSLIPNAVEEFLRYFSPVTASRKCKADIEMHGVQIKEGDVVLVSLPSAGRDEEEFADPESVVFERMPNRHLAFGAGPHRCLGSHLARMEMRVAFEELIDVMPEFELASGFESPWHWGLIFGVDELRVVIPT